MSHDREICLQRAGQRDPFGRPRPPCDAVSAVGVGILFYILASETIGFILCAFIILAASKQRRIRASFQRA